MVRPSEQLCHTVFEVAAQGAMAADAASSEFVHAIGLTVPLHYSSVMVHGPVLVHDGSDAQVVLVEQMVEHESISNNNPRQCRRKPTGMPNFDGSRSNVYLY